jgi:nucleoside-diphosphate-sugar epimerase
VVPQLLAAGHSVVGLARDKSKWPDAPPEMRFVACDITHAANVIQCFGGESPEAVLHLATAIPAGKPSAQDWQRNDEVRRSGTENLTEAALLADAYYIQQSVHYVLAPQGDNWITEDSQFLRPAGRIESAIDAERIFHHIHQRGLRGCVLRPATFFSRQSSQTMMILNALKSGMPILVGNGQNFWSFIHPDDVGGAIVRALEVQPPGDVYNLADNEPVRMGDALRWLAEHLHAHPPKSIAPFLAKMALGGDAVDLLTSSRRIANGKAKAELGWEPRYPTFREEFTREQPGAAAS